MRAVMAIYVRGNVTMRTSESTRMGVAQGSAPQAARGSYHPLVIAVDDGETGWPWATGFTMTYGS
jgi:hypothetical protein